MVNCDIYIGTQIAISLSSFCSININNIKKSLIVATKAETDSESITSNEGQGFVSVSAYASMQASSVRRRCCCTPAPPVATPSPLRSRLLARRRLAASLSHLAAGSLARRAALFHIQNYSQPLQKLSVQ